MTEEAKRLEQRLAYGELSIVHRLTDRFEAEIITDVLDSEEVVHEVRLSLESAYSFLFEPQRGFGVIVVRTVDAERAMALIAEVQAHDPEAAEQAARDAEDSIADLEGPAGS
jgi:hypothetical protein